MEKIEDGWYAKIGNSYRGDREAAPFKSPWEVFNFYCESYKAVFVSKGKDVLLMEPKSPKSGEPKIL